MAVPPGLHGRDLPYYFPSLEIDVPELAFPIFNNTAFIDAFAQSFTSFAISLNPNVKISPMTITPTWKKWSAAQTEMLFNKTVADAPDVRPIRTSDKLLERCECVFFAWSFVYNIVDTLFVDSGTASAGLRASKIYIECIVTISRPYHNSDTPPGQSLIRFQARYKHSLTLAFD
jgi:hypothetical protein